MSPTGVVFELGTPPSPTRASQTATLYLRQDRLERALDLVLEGIAEDRTNPVHYFVAGAAYARLGELVEADAMFDEAERIYPAYELETELEREAAWGRAFNDGLETYANGDIERTLQLWLQATSIFDLRAEAHRNLASLLAAEGRRDEAVGVYRAALAGLSRRPVTKVLTEDELRARDESVADVEGNLAVLLVLSERFEEAVPLLQRQLERDPTSVPVRSDLAHALDGLGQRAEARELYASLISEEELAATELFNLGVALFRASDFEQSADAFRRLTGLHPDSRDAWFNYANALFAAEAWARLAEVGDRLIGVEPLGESALLITARAQLEIGNREAALATLARAEAAPVYLDGLRMRRERDRTSVVGRVVGNVAEAGTSVVLRFTFFGDAGTVLGAEVVSLVAPAAGQHGDFEVSFGSRASAYRYEQR